MTTVTSPTVKVALRQRKWGLIRLASPIVLLALWQLGSALGLIPQDVLPAPSLIAEAGVELIEQRSTGRRTAGFGGPGRSRDCCSAD